MSGGVGKDAVDKVLAGVVDYTIVHFTHEQKEMVKCGYPNYAQHKKLHDDFVSHAKELLNNARADKSVASIETMRTMRNWLVDHILKQDKLYSPFMVQRKAA